MKMRIHPLLKILSPCLLLVLMLSISTSVRADESYVHGYFRYTVADDSVTITAYTGDEEAVTVPSMIAGNPVNTIASGAFAGAEHTTTIYLPDTIMTTESGAFSAVQSVIFSDGNEAGSVPSAEGKENDTGSAGGISDEDGSAANNDNDGSDEDSSTANNSNDGSDEDGSKTDGGEPKAGAIPGIRDERGNLITTDDEGNLVWVDPDGNETVLDDTQKYTIEIGKNNLTTILSEAGDLVTIENGARVSFVDGNRSKVTVDADGSKTVRNKESKYSYEEKELGDPSKTETETVSEVSFETEIETSLEDISATEGDTAQEEKISADSSVPSERQLESGSREGTGSTLPVVILCIAVIAIAAFLIVRRNNHDH